VLKKAKRPMIIVGQGALARADGAAILALAAKMADACKAVTAEWNGFGVLHTAAARVGGLDIGFVPGEGGKDVAAMMGALDVSSCSAPTRSTWNAIGRGLHRLYRHAWRCRRAPRRRHPAGRDLHGKVGHLCQHGRPRADDQPRRLRAG
jgi:hypothetical protein